MASLRPIGIVIVAVVAGFFLMHGTARFATSTAHRAATPAYYVGVQNDSGDPLDVVRLLAMPSDRGAYAIADNAVVKLPPNGRHTLYLDVDRDASLRVELSVGETIHRFDDVAPLESGEEQRLDLVLTPGPRVNGLTAGSTRPVE